MFDHQRTKDFGGVIHLFYIEANGHVGTDSKVSVICRVKIQCKECFDGSKGLELTLEAGFRVVYRFGVNAVAEEDNILSLRINFYVQKGFQALVEILKCSFTTRLKY